MQTIREDEDTTSVPGLFFSPDELTQNTTWYTLYTWLNFLPWHHHGLLSSSFFLWCGWPLSLSLSHACICCTCPIEERVKITYVTYKILCLHLSLFLSCFSKKSLVIHILSGFSNVKKDRVLSSHVLLQSHHNFCREEKLECISPQAWRRR